MPQCLSVGGAINVVGTNILFAGRVATISVMNVLSDMLLDMMTLQAIE